MLIWRRLFLLCCFLLLGCEEDGETLTGSEIAQLLNVERRISFSGFRFSGAATIRPNQTFDIEVWSLGEDKGRWWIEDDQLCSQWNTFRGGRTLCSAVRKNSDGSYEILRPGGLHKLATFRLDDKS